MNAYKVFTRAWYKADGITPNYGARKTTLKKYLSESEARDFCTVWNKNHNPGKRSVKAEFERMN